MPLLAILFLSIVVTFFGMFCLWLAKQLGKKRPFNAVQSDVYECGVRFQPAGGSRVNVKFYLVAILFIVFDIEVVFLFPWAIVFRDFVEQGYGQYLLGMMLFFLAVFTFGLIWEIKSKALDWE